MTLSWAVVVSAAPLRQRCPQAEGDATYPQLAPRRRRDREAGADLRRRNVQPWPLRRVRRWPRADPFHAVGCVTSATLAYHMVGRTHACTSADVPTT